MTPVQELLHILASVIEVHLESEREIVLPHFGHLRPVSRDHEQRGAWRDCGGSRGLGSSEQRRGSCRPPRPRGSVGVRRPPSSRSYASIVRANTLTLFNLILAVAGGATLLFGEWQDALFLGVLVSNSAIGIVQEVRAKRTLDRLSALVAPTARVVRDGRVQTLPIDEIVEGDLIHAQPGDQVVADGSVTRSDGPPAR